MSIVRGVSLKIIANGIKNNVHFWTVSWYNSNISSYEVIIK